MEQAGGELKVPAQLVQDVANYVRLVDDDYFNLVLDVALEMKMNRVVVFDFFAYLHIRMSALLTGRYIVEQTMSACIEMHHL